MPIGGSFILNDNSVDTRPTGHDRATIMRRFLSESASSDRVWQVAFVP